MPLRRGVIRRRLNKSHRIGIDTFYVFRCAAASLSDIFGTAVTIALSWSIAPKFSRQSFFVREVETAVPKICDDYTAGQ